MRESTDRAELKVILYFCSENLKIMGRAFVYLYLCSCLLTITLCKNHDHPEYLLFDKLFDDYNPDVRPTLEYQHTLLVNVSVNLIALHSLEERSQTLSATIWIDLEWTDVHLTWNRSEYNNIQSIIVPAEKIWNPDICVTNEVTNSKCLVRSDDGKALLEHTGKVTIWWNKEVKTGCDVDISQYPFDRQNCSIKIGTWYSVNEKIKLVQKSDKLDLDNFSSNEEWDIVFSNVTEIPVEDELNYTDLQFSMIIDRRPLFYLYSTVLPILLLSILNMVCFVVPVESGEKIGMTMAIFLTFAVFMTMISSDVPRSTEHVFKFGIFMTMHLLMSGTTILLEVLVTNIYYKPRDMKMNRVYEWMFRRLVENDKNDNEISATHPANDRERLSCAVDATDPWQKLSLRLDKLFGYFVTSINTLLIISFFVTVSFG